MQENAGRIKKIWSCSYRRAKNCHREAARSASFAWKENKTMNYRNTVLCHEDCNFRNRAAPFCGYCMYRILNMKERKKENGNRQEQDEDTRKTEGNRI